MTFYLTLNKLNYKLKGDIVLRYILNIMYIMHDY